MYGPKRVQLSLVFYDADFYKEFIDPCKMAKELNPLVMKLLEAYFKSADVQDVIDNYGLEPEDGEGASTAFNTTWDNATNMLAMLNNIVATSKSSIEDGIDDINAFAEATGGSPAHEDEYGMTVPSFASMEEMEKMKAEQTAKEQAAQAVPQISMEQPAVPVVDEAATKRIDALENVVQGLNGKVDNMAMQYSSLAGLITSMATDMKKLTGEIPAQPMQPMMGMPMQNGMMMPNMPMQGMQMPGTMPTQGMPMPSMPVQTPVQTPVNPVQAAAPVPTTQQPSADTPVTQDTAQTAQDSDTSSEQSSMSEEDLFANMYDDTEGTDSSTETSTDTLDEDDDADEDDSAFDDFFDSGVGEML